ncbi:MAG: hypothetical protein ACC682_12935 [Gemmatimonadota bacterium]
MRAALAVSALILVAPPADLVGQETRELILENRTDTDVWVWYQRPGEQRRRRVGQLPAGVEIRYEEGPPVGVTWRLCAQAWIEGAEPHCRNFEGVTRSGGVRRDGIYFTVTDDLLERSPTAIAKLEKDLDYSARRWWATCEQGVDAFGRGSRYRGLLKAIRDPDWGGRMDCFEELVCRPAGRLLGQEVPQGFLTRQGNVHYIWREMYDPDQRLGVPCDP